MLTFLFWNMGGRTEEGDLPHRARGRKERLASILGNLAHRHAVDLLILGECPLLPREVMRAINGGSAEPFREPDPNSLCSRITIYPRFPRMFVKLRQESDKYTCRAVELPGRTNFTLWAVHFASKLFKDDDSQSQAMPGFSAIIRSLEKQHDRTLVVGDLNMNPFETGMVSAEGLNAVMSRDVASGGHRVIESVQHPFFYNPMWSHFGDSTHGLHPPGDEEHEPPGTCYYSSSRSKWYFWNMYDQVLVRPTLLPSFTAGDPRILVTDGNTSLITDRGRPDRSAVSDHLPLLFHLEV